MTRVLTLSLTTAGLLSAQAETLYSTDFDDFPVGNNAWAGFDGWISNDTSSGAQAIDDGLLSGSFGRSAALGFNRPVNGFTFVAKPINYDPAVGENSLVELRAEFGIEDSTEFTNFRRDDFFLSIYNIAGTLLASIRISNTDTDFGFWRRDGSLLAGGSEFDTGFEFVHGQLNILNARIDLENNVWSAFIGGVPLFENITFNGTGQSRTIGLVAVEWQVAAAGPAGFGDNWILVDYIRVDTLELDPPALKFDSVVETPSDGVTLTWKAGPGYDYTVEYSEDLVTWLPNLPNSAKLSPLYEVSFNYTDATNPKPAERYYRLVRTPKDAGT